MTKLEQGRALLAKATPEPWSFQARPDGDIGFYGPEPGEISIGKVYSHAGEWDDDAALITFAVNNLAALLDCAEAGNRLRAASENYRLQHDLRGDASKEAGRAWDILRRAEAGFAKSLAHLEGAQS